ncbi:MAG: hypothetical protein AAGF12_18275 [Myxococcota bacterium]
MMNHLLKTAAVVTALAGSGACGDDDDPMTGMDASTGDAMTNPDRMVTPDGMVPDGMVEDADVDAEVDAEVDAMVDAMPMALSFETDVYPILTASCGNGNNTGCHLETTNSNAGGLTFAPDPSAALMNLNRMANQCAVPLVDPGNETGSALFQKVNGTMCGTRMPRGRMALDTMDIDTIRDWIAGGAMP